MSQPKNILVTHGNCPDGAAAAVILSKARPDLEVVFGQHTQINDQILKAGQALADGGSLYLADICGDPPVIHNLQELFKERGSGLYIYEHHQSRSYLSELQQPKDLRGEIVFDLRRCGSKILFDALSANHPELSVYREFVDLTNDRDLWLNRDPRSVHLVKLHNILGDAGYIARFKENPSVVLTEKESIILEYQSRKDQEKIDKLLEKIEVKVDDIGLRYGVVFGEGDSSEMLHQAIEKNDLEYAIHINLNSKKGSIRSRGNFDCAAFAEKRGGGGHKAASGFPVRFDRPRF